MLNMTLLKPVNILIITAIVLIWHLTIGKFFAGHIEKDTMQNG